MVPGGTKMVPRGTKMAPRGTKIETKWYQNGTWRVEKIEKRGDPEKKPNNFSHAAPFLTKNDEKVLVFKAILKNRKVEKRSLSGIRPDRI